MKIYMISLHTSLMLQVFTSMIRISQKYIFPIMIFAIYRKFELSVEHTIYS